MFCFILVCIVILYLVYCLSIFIFSIYQHRKPTTIETLLNYDVNIDDTHVSIVTESEKYKNIYANSIPFVRFDASLTDSSSSSSSYVTDTYTYASARKNLKVQTVLDDQKVFLLIKKRDSYSYETLDDMIRNYRIVGYPSQIHKNLFEFICKANEVDISAIKMKETSNLDEVDVLLFFDSLSNIKKLENSYNNIDIITYDGYNIHLLKFYLPYCKIKGINLKDFPGYLDRFPVKTCIVFDMILAGVKYIPEIGVPLVAESNYMTLYFEFLPESLSVLGRSNKHILTRSSKQILEQFTVAVAIDDSQPITIEPKHAINGYLIDNKFYYDMTHIDGIPLVSGMKIILKQQWNDTENGKYTTSDNPMIFIKDVAREANEANEVGECIDHPNIKTESTCPTTWDKRCDINEECPFYQANKKYPNYFGGCESGYCQMPLGIKRTGYRKYDKTSKALCYDADGVGGTRAECNTDDKPDYAFELDQFQRLTNFHK